MNVVYVSCSLSCDKRVVCVGAGGVRRGGGGASASRLTARPRCVVVVLRALTSPLDNGRRRPGPPPLLRAEVQSLVDPLLERVPLTLRTSGILRPRGAECETVQCFMCNMVTVFIILSQINL